MPSGVPTNLPSAIHCVARQQQPRDFDVIEGDSNYDQTLSDWREAGGGVKVPFHQVITINGLKIFDTTVTEASANSALPADAFGIPAELRGKAAGVSVIDDYGHHPTEIRATLAAARQCGFRKIHVIFQPHRYTRTRDLMEEFTGAFSDADSLFVLDIYAASEAPIEGINGEALAQKIREKTVKVGRYAGSPAEAIDAAVEVAA